MEQEQRKGYKCQYCNSDTEVIDMRYGQVNQCTSCGAYVSLSVETGLPNGCTADAELRRERRSLHVVIDRLIKRKMDKDNVLYGNAKEALYKYIMNQMGFDFAFNSIAQLDIQETLTIKQILKRI